MSLDHAIVWIDHHQAHVIHFNAEASEQVAIKTHSTHPHLHHKSGSSGSGHAATSAKYLHEVIEAVSDAAEILIVGPGKAKLELMRHAHAHDPKVEAKVVGVETVDHPTDKQLLAHARAYFVRIDNLNGRAVLSN